MYFKAEDYVVDIESTSFYKYKSLSFNTLKSLESNRVWFSSPKTFNDPLDCKPPFILEDSNSDYGQEILESLLDGSKKISEESAIFCMSTVEPISHLMWSHYADGHKGVCIEYEITKDSVIPVCIDNLKSTVQHEKPLLVKVQYDFEKIELDKIMVLDTEIAIFGLKSKAWEYEGECRLISQGYSSDSDGVEIEFPGSIKSITFGLNTPKDDRNFIYNIFRDRKVSFFEITVKDGSYKLVREEYVPIYT